MKPGRGETEPGSGVARWAVLERASSSLQSLDSMLVPHGEVRVSWHSTIGNIEPCLG